MIEIAILECHSLDEGGGIAVLIVPYKLRAPGDHSLEHTKTYIDILTSLALELSSLDPQDMKKTDRQTLTAIGYTPRYEQLYQKAQSQVFSITDEMGLLQFKESFLAIKRIDFHDEMGRIEKFELEKNAVVTVVRELAEHLRSLVGQDAPPPEKSRDRRARPSWDHRPRNNRSDVGVSPQVPQESKGRIYISHHYGQKFRQQLAVAVENSGSSPVFHEPEDEAWPPDYIEVVEQIKSCNGAIFCFTDFEPDPSFSPEDLNDHLDRVEQEILMEFGMAYATFPDKVLMILTEDGISGEWVPAVLRDMSYFMLAAPEMTFQDGMDLLHKLQGKSWADITRETIT